MRVLLLALAVTADLAASQSAPSIRSVRLPDGGTITMPAIDGPALTRLPVARVGGGEVDIETVVSAAGVAAHARVSRSTDPTGVLDADCLEALKQWRFRPATNVSRPVASLVLVRFTAAQPEPSQPAVLSARIETVSYNPLPPFSADLAAEAAVPRPGGGIRFPMPIREVQPNYTPQGMRAKIQGEVSLEVVVATDGTVKSARIVKSLDADHGLDESGLVAARHWLFTPATRDGVALPVRVMLVFEFRLH